MVISTSMEAMPQSTIDFSAAAYVSGTFAGSGLSLTRVSASYIITGSDTTASFAYTASNAVSASYAFLPANANFTTVTSSRILLGPGTDASAILYISESVPGLKYFEVDSASVEVFEINAAGRTKVTNLLATGSLFGTASYIPSILSRGGTFSDLDGINLNLGVSQSIAIWRAPYVCSVSAVYSTIVGYPGLVSAATATVRKNFLGTMLTSSVIPLSGSWGVFTAISQSSFVAGDTLEVMLISSSNYPLAVTIQVDFTK
jgi:hypothetical protein